MPSRMTLTALSMMSSDHEWHRQDFMKCASRNEQSKGIKLTEPFSRYPCESSPETPGANANATPRESAAGFANPHEKSRTKPRALTRRTYGRRAEPEKIPPPLRRSPTTSHCWPGGPQRRREKIKSSSSPLQARQQAIAGLEVLEGQLHVLGHRAQERQH